MRKATFEPGLAEKILLYIDSATGWKGGGEGARENFAPTTKDFGKMLYDGRQGMQGLYITFNWFMLRFQL